MMPDLTELRVEIDKLDSEMVRLFVRRMDICAHVAEYKRAKGLPVQDGAREEALLAKVEAAGAEHGAAARALYAEILRLSREYQTQLLGQNGGEGHA